ncbi:hypothetical protein SprV_0602075300 [Sparganum proliferum]
MNIVHVFQEFNAAISWDSQLRSWVLRRNDEWKNFFSAIKAVYGPPTKGTAPLLSADDNTLLTEKTQILQRWAEHFRGILNCPSAISDAAVDRMPKVETNMELDLPPSLKETIRPVQQLSNGKAPGSDAITAEVYKHGGPQLMDHLTALFQETWHQDGAQLHDGMMARVTDNEAVSEAFAETNGVKQGCVLAPTIFSLMFSAMLMDAYRDERPGIRIAYRTDGQLLNQRRMRFQSRVSTTTVHELLFADDCALNTTSEAEMQRSVVTFNAPVIFPNYLTSDRHRLIMSSDSTSQPIAGTHTFDLPSVWLGDIALWLRTVESRFALRQITREDTKFHYVVAALPMVIATDLRDIIDWPPTEAPYTALKEALISRISLSTQKRLQRLISEEDLGNRKPTQLLRRLEQLADGQMLDATMFKQLFLQRLPPSVQAILAPNIPSSTVQTLAATADRILEYYQPPVTVNVASRSTIAPTIEDVVKRLDALTLEVSQLRATRGYNPRSPAITRRPRSPTPNQPTVDGFCWYHHNYGSNAHRCHSPCKYKTPALENPHADQ